MKQNSQIIPNSEMHKFLMDLRFGLTFCPCIVLYCISFCIELPPESQIYFIRLSYHITIRFSYERGRPYDHALDGYGIFYRRGWYSINFFHPGGLLTLSGNPAPAAIQRPIPGDKGIMNFTLVLELVKVLVALVVHRVHLTPGP